MEFKGIQKVILLGGGQGCLDCILVLKNSPFRVSLFVGPRHLNEPVVLREEQLSFSEALEKTNTPYLIVENINQDEKAWAEINQNTLGLSFGAPWIFKKEFIQHFQGRLLNCHGSRLPQDRGGGGYSWRIMMKDPLGYSLIHQVVAGIDTGEILAFNEFIFPKDCSIPKEYRQHYLKENKIFLGEFFKKIEKEEAFASIHQPEYLSTYWPRLNTDIHGFIDWDWSLEDIAQFICAFDYPYKGASTFLGGKRVRVHGAQVLKKDGTFHPFQRGIIYRQSKDNIFIATKEGTLVLSEILDFETEAPLILHVGDRLYTPREHLEKALEYRAIYTSKGLK